MGKKGPVKGAQRHNSPTSKCVLHPSGLSLPQPPFLSLPRACHPPGIPKGFPAHSLPVVSSGSGAAVTGRLPHRPLWG